MKREDAIKTLKELWRETNDPWYEEVYNMAINALEADRKTEPTGDNLSAVEDETQTEEPPMDEYYKDHDEFYEPQERSRE